MNLSDMHEYDTCHFGVVALAEPDVAEPLDLVDQDPSLVPQLLLQHVARCNLVVNCTLWFYSEPMYPCLQNFSPWTVILWSTH